MSTENPADKLAATMSGPMAETVNKLGSVISSLAIQGATIQTQLEVEQRLTAEQGKIIETQTALIETLRAELKELQTNATR